ncbi:TipAS antibiotic-recognition domain-containing protein [Streptomyces roseofulvus]|uniref:TipAS antibiotic-recognition domain-containing protein n=1 Tax=Streptomyces TaxID=1883 RepID=UPI003D2F8356
MDLVEAHRHHLTAWFFDCRSATHVRIAGTYLADENLHAFYASIREGLPEHLVAAVRANARRAETPAG